ncbi:MAG: hypothetical protein DMD54_17000 [Gemmatimonadetes bacterium]|nr:MAG: hypothetical protein DMD54_17000 [Gemmatimonadota bacterium]
MHDSDVGSAGAAAGRASSAGVQQVCAAGPERAPDLSRTARHADAGSLVASGRRAHRRPAPRGRAAAPASGPGAGGRTVPGGRDHPRRYAHSPRPDVSPVVSPLRRVRHAATRQARPRRDHGFGDGKVGDRGGVSARAGADQRDSSRRGNLERLLEAISLLRSRPRTRDVVLVHSGPEGWQPEQVFRRARELRLDGAARFLGYTPGRDLQVLYGLARAFVYPSLWEAFGIPVIEAMACGCPVVTSGLSSLPEIAGNAALFVDPHSVEEIANGVAAVWSDDARRADLVRKGLERVREFTWERAARATIAVYEAALV